MSLQRYIATRHYWEIGLWAGFLFVGFAANVAVILIELERTDSTIAPWEVFAWEGTSTLALAALIPLVLWFDTLFPIEIPSWRRSLLAHALFTAVFSLLHVAIMYWARVGLYAIVGDNDGYRWPDWWSEFGYEYLKDFRSYMLLVAVFYLYRFVLRRLQGEAGFIAEGREDTEPVMDRFLVKKLGREFLVRVQDIDWIEASGNYVNLHVDARVFPLRETMTNVSERLKTHGFQRVHRSAVVNLDRVAEIVPFETGDGEARLQNDTIVPVSRRFRKELRDRLG